MARFRVGGQRAPTPRLKRCFQILVIGTIVFMVCVSFLILQPDFFYNPGQGTSIFAAFGRKLEPDESEDVLVNPINLPTSMAKLKNGEAMDPIAPGKVVDQLVKKYRVDFSKLLKPGQSPWKIAASWVTPRQVLPEPAPELGAILHAMATAPIIGVDNGIRGTQLKLSMNLSGGQLVAFKPKWYDRDYIVQGQPFAGRDRHNGEIAAFHLSRILGFRKTPLAVGRIISLSRDLIPVASKDLLETFHEYEGSTCFYSKCLYCNKENSLCTKGDSLEGTIIMWLPPTIHLKLARNPWRRTYREKLLARWEKDEGYCSIVRQIEPFLSDHTLLLDLIDTTVFDYLIGNADRHHYETVDGVKNGMLVMLDNGKSFGNPYEDERSILAPLYQCCSIRFSTWRRLLSLQNSILSTVLKEVLIMDPLHPVLTTQHLQAIDRRLEKVLHEVEKCIQAKGLKSVILEAKDQNEDD